jgi:phospholipid-transporting ATPase
MDPFFDDEDDAFAHSAPSIHPQESGLPLAKSAAPFAGSGPSTSSLPGDSIPQNWTFDDEEYQAPGRRPEKSRSTSDKWRWKWPWQKDKILTGERVVALNKEAVNAGFASNFVSTSKYNLVTFVPKFLAGIFVSGAPK